MHDIYIYIYTAQSCGLSAAIQCGSVAASCGATCYNSGITSSTCISCLGSSYSTCKDCIARLYEEKKQGIKAHCYINAMIIL